MSNTFDVSYKKTSILTLQNNKNSSIASKVVAC